MTPPTITLEDLRKALAEQDRRLAAAFEELNPKSTLPIPTVGLRLLAEMCARAAAAHPPAEQPAWGTVRC